MAIYRLSEEGHLKFNVLYNEIKNSCNRAGSVREGYNNSLKRKIENMQKDKSLFTLLDPDIKLEKKIFKDNFEFGSYIKSKLDSLNQEQIFYDYLFWDWLSLYYFDVIFHEKTRGLDEKRIFLSADWLTRYRHLVRSPWYMVKTYGNNSKFCLDRITGIGGDYLEQFISHRVIENYLPSAEIANKLYYDNKSGKSIPGFSKIATIRGKKRVIVKGSLGRLIAFINRYNEIYNIWDISAEEFLKLLPDEFKEPLRKHE